MIGLEQIEQVCEPDVVATIKDILDHVKGIDNPKRRQAEGWRVLLDNFETELDFIQSLAWIVLKDPDGGVAGTTTMRLKRQQLYLLDLQQELERQRKPVRILVLKARQIGISTYAQADGIYRVLTKPNFRASVVAHSEKATMEIFGIASNIVDNLLFTPELVTDRRDEIKTALGARYTVCTAGSKEIGRAMRAHWAHLSELGFWEDAERNYFSFMQTIGRKPGTTVIGESTANGMANLLYDLWKIAMSRRVEVEWVPVFFPWYDEPEYQIPQTTAQSEELRETLDAEEKWLMTDGYPIWNRENERYRLSFEQIAWRRGCIAKDRKSVV